jgi:hypothetical protein
VIVIVCDDVCVDVLTPHLIRDVTSGIY